MLEPQYAIPKGPYIYHTPYLRVILLIKSIYPLARGRFIFLRAYDFKKMEFFPPCMSFLLHGIIIIQITK